MKSNLKPTTKNKLFHTIILFSFIVIHCTQAKGTCLHDPVFTNQSPACGTVISATVGVQVQFSLGTSDADGVGTVLTISSGALPTGAITSPQLPETDNPPSANFLWTPGAGQVGQHVVTFTVTDDCGASSTCSFTISVAPAPPANDLCANAILLSCGNTISGSTVSATNDVGLPSCAGSGSHGIWYKLVGTGDVAKLHMSNCSANGHFELKVLTGSCNSLSCIGGSANPCSNDVSFITTGGTTYLILIPSVGTNASGTFDLTLTCTPALPNDRCIDAIPITCGNTVTGTNIGATVDNGVPNCNITGLASLMVWYKFVGNGDVVTISTCAGTNFDSRLRVYTNGCTNLTCLAGSDNSCGSNEELIFSTTSGTDYLVLIDGAGNAVSGNFTLSLACGAPANCDITGASLVNTGSCNDNSTSDPTDDYFTADVEVSFSNPPPTGNLEIALSGDVVSGGGSTSVSAAGLSSPHTFTGIRFKADGTVTTADVLFTASQNCNQTITGPIVQPCSVTNPIFTAPVLTCPAAVTVSCAGDVPIADPTSVSETHACPGNVTITHLSDVISNQDCVNGFTITRTYQATDDCNNSSTCSQSIIVDDQTSPVINCLPDMSLCGGAQVVNFAIPTATDNCSAVVSQTGGLSPGSVFPVGTTVNTFSATDLCGNSVSCSFNVTINSIGSNPGTITGLNAVCKNQSGINYCVPALPFTTYIWTLPSGVTLQSNANGPCITLKFNSNFNGGTLCVKAIFPCGVSSNSCLIIVSLSSSPNKPGTITGSTSICPNTCETYTIAAVSKATEYQWTTPAGLNISSGQGTTSVVVCASAGFTGGSLSVFSKNCKGSSAARSISLTGNPSTPGSISGNSSVCQFATKCYSISSITGATSYTWNVNNGAVIHSGQGTKNACVKFNASTSNQAILTVKANNACGSSALSSKTISVNANCKTDPDGNEIELNDEASAELFEVYPNPASSLIYVKFNSDRASNYSLIVFDVYGNEVINENISAVDGLNFKEVNLERISKGIYIIELLSEDKTPRSLRIIVQ